MKISEIRITILMVNCYHTVLLFQMNKGFPQLLCHSLKMELLYLFGIVFKTSDITTAGSLYSFGIVVPLMYFCRKADDIWKALSANKTIPGSVSERAPFMRFGVNKCSLLPTH